MAEGCFGNSFLEKPHKSNLDVYHLVLGNNDNESMKNKYNKVAMKFLE